MMICADIGNSGTKFAAYPDNCPAVDANDPPVPLWTARVATLTPSQPFPRPLPALANRWVVASVDSHRQAALRAWIEQNRPADRLQLLSHRDIPLQLAVDQPERTGIDRMVAATAAWNRTGRKMSLIVVDAGTAVTVDLVEFPGVFRGGNIFPGAEACFGALGGATDQLPALQDDGRFPDEPLGSATESAIRSGVYRMQAGAVRFLVEQLQQRFEVSSQEVIVTGGAILAIRKLLPAEWTFSPGLVLDGIRHLACLKR